MELAIIIAVVVVALVFDYTNGFHDAANAIATSVSTRALTPRVALVMAAVMNFVGAFLGQKVAHTVSETIAPPARAATDWSIVMAGLLGAITWNLITWYFGLPSSSSHALIGGLVGAALAAGATVQLGDRGRQGRHPDGGLARWSAFALGLRGDARDHVDLPPRATRDRVNRGFRIAQTVSAAAMALGHGLQDAQKTMGVIFLALLTGGYVAERRRPAAVGDHLRGRGDLARHLVRRLAHHAHPGPPDHRPRPRPRFAAESVGRRRALHDGATSSRRRSRPPTRSPRRSWASAPPSALSAVRWGVARSILMAWVLTFPMAGLAARPVLRRSCHLRAVEAPP